MQKRITKPEGLYDPQHEHDACGVGFVANVKGKKSHEIIVQALTVLKNLTHRGACGCEVNTGDGAGILLQIPHTFLKNTCAKLGIQLPGPKEYGVGVIFLPPNPAERKEAEKVFETIIKEEGQTCLGWRDIKTDNRTLGPTAVSSESFVRQVYVGRNSKLQNDDDFERKLYVIRRRAENLIRYSGKFKQGNYFWVSSLSHRTIIYKGMLLSEQVEEYFPELMDPSVESALALVHSLFQAGTVLILTATSLITEKSIPSVEMSIGCMPGK